MTKPNFYDQEDAAYGNSPDTRYEILELYKEKKAYVTKVSSRECEVFDIEHEFHRHDIYPDAQFAGYENLGMLALLL